MNDSTRKPVEQDAAVPEVESAWAPVIARRAREVLDGPAATRDLDEALDELEARARAQPPPDDETRAPCTLLPTWPRLRPTSLPTRAETRRHEWNARLAPHRVFSLLVTARHARKRPPSTSKLDVAGSNPVSRSVLVGKRWWL